VTREMIGYRTPLDRGFLIQPTIAIVHEDGVSWCQEPSSRHVADFRPLPDGYALQGVSMDGLYWCVDCGFLVEPIWSDGVVLDAWHDLVTAVTSQDDWDEEIASGPLDIYNYVAALLQAQPEDAL
jgi:hypothetical protein